MILDGLYVANQRNAHLKELLKQLPRALQLAIIVVGDNKASETYVRNKLKRASEVGILAKKYHFEADVSEVEILSKIKELNGDMGIDGIIVQLPLPKHLDEDKILNQIKPEKDVDGFTTFNQGKLFQGKKAIRPATPQGIINLLKHYQIEVEGKHVVIVGRSQIVGMPIAKMLLDLNATSTICHSKTKNLSAITKTADILIAAVGKANMIKSDMVQTGVIIVDVGINHVEGKLTGDVDYRDVLDKVSWISPVPKGVGPMTINALLENTYLAYQLNEENKDI